MVKKQKIKKGNHYANSWWFPPFITLSNNIKGTVKFNSDFEYNSNGDTNKLIGLSDNWHHHKDSIRLGWRWNNTLDCLEIMIIKYSKSIREISLLKRINKSDLTKKHDFEIIIEKENYLISFSGETKTLKRDSKWSFLRVILKPYFGGKDKAPKDFKFNIKTR